MSSTINICSAAAAFALAASTMAQDAKPAAPTKETKTLTIGDAAPAIDISDWIKGNKVEKFEDGKVYIVEFWATWCGPCKVSMPHLGELQTQYKDYGVTFIGISDEPLETVTKWLDTPTKKDGDTKWRDAINYTLTTDPDKSVKNDYFSAAGQRGIPSAFIVGKDQKIEWIGNPHPMSDDGFDKALEAVVKDQWDRAKFKSEFEGKAAAEKAAAESERALSQAMKAKDWKKVVEIADQRLAADPKDREMAMLKFVTMAGEMNESAKGYEFVKTYLNAHYWEDAMVLNDFAWAILDTASIKEKDLNYAVGLAMRAVKLSEEKEPAILDTYARCWFERGNLEEAVKWQAAAAKLAPDNQMGEEIKATLKKYEEAAGKKGG